MRVFIVAATLSTLVGATPGCLYHTRYEGKHIQQVEIRTNPGGASLWRITPEDKHFLGRSRAELQLPYHREEIRQFNRLWWWVIGPLAVASLVSGIMLSSSIPDDGGAEYFGGSVGFICGSLLLAGLGLSMDGLIFPQTVPAEPQEIEVSATLDGYLEQVATVVVPSDTRLLEIALPPDPNGKSAEDPGAASVFKKSADAVAVFDIQDPTGLLDAKTRDLLTDYLAAALARATGLWVVPRRQIQEELAGEKGKSHDLSFDEKYQIEVGKAVAAQKLLSTKLLRVGNQCAVVATLYDLKTEIAEKSALHRTNCSHEELLNSLDTIAKQLR